MKLLITGASGFLGDYVVTEALRCGHQVRALVRPSSCLSKKLSGLSWFDIDSFDWQSDVEPPNNVHQKSDPFISSHNNPGHNNSRHNALDLSETEQLVGRLNAQQIPTTFDPSLQSSQASTASNLELAAVDLATGIGLSDALQDIDAVIHLAAAKTGDYATQVSNTVTATTNLLTAMEQTGVLRLVAIGSFSVYDHLHQPVGAMLDESAPIERRGHHRDAYAQTKLQQEHLVCQFQTRCHAAVTLLRPGIIFGRSALWPAHLGAKLKGNLWLQIGSQARLPLTYVENCAEAIVKAVESDRAIGQIINVVDDDRPTQQDYIDCLRHHRAQSITPQPPFPTTIKVPWNAMRRIARGAWTVNRVFGQRLPLPGILVPSRLHARFKPLDYSNYLAKTLLNWTPRYALSEAISRSLLELNRQDLNHQKLNRQHRATTTQMNSNSSSLSNSPSIQSVTSPAN